MRVDNIRGREGEKREGEPDKGSFATLKTMEFFER